TRVSFEVAMAHLGGHALFLSPRDTQLGRGEPIADTARVLSSMCDAIMVRNDSQADLETLAAHSAVPVINALTDDFHPCQLLADMQTFVEHRGSIQGKKVVWVGDGNNMCASYINAANQFDFELVISSPNSFEPDSELLNRYPERVRLEADVNEAVKGAHLVVTDVWASMGQEDEQQARLNAFEGYQVTPELMDRADPDALFMHCLPAHRGEEVSHEMMDDPRSVVWDEAENRLHAQKALLEFLLTGQH
ncbi:MAG: ornithine carbamoyltransferase, partial [Alcanivorax sp.]